METSKGVLALNSREGEGSKGKKDWKPAITWLKSKLFYIVIAGEVFIPLWFLICLRTYDETRFVLIYCQGAMVVLTSGILVGMILDLVLEVLRD